MALFGLLKSRYQRQLEWDMHIQNVLDLFRRRIRELNKHERGYAEKAVRARRSGDKANYDKLARLLVQTINERRRLDSSLLAFESLVQTKERIEGYSAFAKGLASATKSIASVFRNIDLSRTMLDLNMAMSQARQMDRTMGLVLDRISGTALDFEPSDDESVRFEQIDSMIAQRAQTDESQTDDKIDSLLRDIETQLKKDKEPTD